MKYQVGALDIPMDDSISVEVSNSLSNVCGKSNSLSPWQVYIAL